VGTFKFRGAIAELSAYAARYAFADDSVVVDRGQRCRSLGRIELDDLRVFARWKSARIGRKIERNPLDLIEAVSQGVFSLDHPQVRIELLCMLHGVGYPFASTILHMTFPEEFALIDYRALWSLGVEAPPSTYQYDFYSGYSRACADLAQRVGVSMRDLDRALWQYSKEQQRP
jgi:thermostable 8-oxoguanine DNA glycosylase